METAYTWEATPAGGTRMARRDRGEPSGAMGLAAPFPAIAMRRENRKDLARLEVRLEGGRGG